MLIQNGADVNAVNEQSDDGASWRYVTASMKKKDCFMIHLLLRFGAKINEMEMRCEALQDWVTPTNSG